MEGLYTAAMCCEDEDTSQGPPIGASHRAPLIIHEIINDLIFMADESLGDVSGDDKLHRAKLSSQPGRRRVRFVLLDDVRAN